MADPIVHFHVLRTSVEAEPSERAQATGDRLIARADQHEVEMPDADMVRVDVNLFHDEESAWKAFELTPRRGRGPLQLARLYDFRCVKC